MKKMFDMLFKNMEFENDTEKERYEDMYEIFSNGLPETLYLNQYELKDKYPGTEIYEWAKMLKHKPFAAWIKGEIDIIFEANVSKSLVGKHKDSANILKMKKEVMENQSKGEHETYIVMDKSLLYEKKKKDKENE